MRKNLPKNIGNLFKESIENLEQAPSPQVWEKLANSLNSEPINNKKSFSKRTLLLLLLLCLMTCTGIVYQHNKNSKKQNAVEQLSANKKKSTDVIEKNTEKEITSDLEQTVDNKKKERKSTKEILDTAIVLEEVTINKKIETKAVEKKTDEIIITKQAVDKKKSETNTTKNKFDTRKRITKKEDLVQKNYYSKKENTDVAVIENKTKKDLNKKPTRTNNFINDKNNIAHKNIKDNKAVLYDEKIVASSNRSIFYKGRVNISIHAPEAETNEEEITEKEKVDVKEIAKNTIKTNDVKKLAKDSINKKENKKNTATSKTKKKSSLKNKFFVTAFTTAEYANFIIEKNEEITNAYDNSGKIKEREKETGSSTTGILFGYDLNKKFALQLGFTYTMLKVESAATSVFAQKTESGDIAYRYNTSIGYTYFKPSFITNPMIGDSLKATEAEHYLEFMSVPLLLKYKIKMRKWSVHPTIGVTFNFLTKSVLETEVKDGINQEQEIYTKFDGVKKISYSALIVSEIQYNIYKKWSLVALPYFKYSIGSVNKNAIIETKPYFLGVGLGISYKF
jgi:hypothetical protein